MIIKVKLINCINKYKKNKNKMLNLQINLLRQNLNSNNLKINFLNKINQQKI